MNIVIVGGGTAGWMSASYLSVKLPDSKITLIESPTISTIGVGESTVPFFRYFLEEIGIHEETDWMPFCNATYKNGILYEDWKSVGERWWHPFEANDVGSVEWNSIKDKDNDFYSSVYFTGSQGMKDSGKWIAKKDGTLGFDYYHNETHYGYRQHWAYHLDTALFGEYLKNRFINKIVYKTATVNKINQNEHGIASIETENETIDGDIFIDCTGFKRLLIDKVAEPMKSFYPYLTHDKAVVIRHDYLDKKEEMKPRTRTKCLSSGWYWDIPLFNNISNGYVYTSSFISEEQAENELREEIGLERTKDCKALHINIQAGYYEKPYSKNVVAIGLSAGFMEPLEAAGLFTIQMSLLNFVSLDKEQFNANNIAMVNDFVDFISIGYHLSNRTDTPFWKQQKNAHISSRMQNWLSCYRETMNPPVPGPLFNSHSWTAKAIGFGVSSHAKKEFSHEEYLNIQKKIKKIKDFDYKALLCQSEYLEKYVYNNKRSLNG